MMIEDVMAFWDPEALHEPPPALQLKLLDQVCIVCVVRELQQDIVPWVFSGDVWYNDTVTYLGVAGAWVFRVTGFYAGAGC